MSKEKFDQLTQALKKSKSKDITEDLLGSSKTLDVDEYVNISGDITIGNYNGMSNDVFVSGGGAMGSTCSSWSPSATYSANPLTVGSAGSVLYSTGASSTMWTNNTNAGVLSVQGDAEFEGNVKIKGRDVAKLFEKIEDRLAILMDPDLEKLKKYQALKKAYDHYKLLEKLIGNE
jgi:Ni,Fe-hydrogenase I large subunit